MPALVSDSVAAELGQSFSVTMAGQHIDVRVVATASQFPSVVPNAPFVVVSAPALLERQFAIPEAGLTLSEVWANGPDDPSRCARAIWASSPERSKPPGRSRASSRNCRSRSPWA